MRAKAKAVLVEVRNIVLLTLAILVVIAASFLFTGDFSPLAYSDRLVWAAIATVFLAWPASVVLSARVSGRAILAADSGRGEDERPLSSSAGEERSGPRDVIGFALRFWVVSLLVLGASALLTTLFG